VPLPECLIGNRGAKKNALQVLGKVGEHFLGEIIEYMGAETGGLAVTDCERALSSWERSKVLVHEHESGRPSLRSCVDERGFVLRELHMENEIEELLHFGVGKAKVLAGELTQGPAGAKPGKAEFGAAPRNRA
jgi:hypothetical protein